MLPPSVIWNICNLLIVITMCPQTTTNKHSAEDFENQISALKTLFGDVVDYVYFLPPKRSKYFASLELSLLIDSVCIENSLPPRFQSLFR